MAGTQQSQSPAPAAVTCPNDIDEVLGRVTTSLASLTFSTSSTPSTDGPLDPEEPTLPDKDEDDDDKMADPFEVRMRFTNQLRQLNASVTSAQKAAQFALKNKELAEDLHSCILEQLERNNTNTRANILYFVDHFLDMANRDGHTEYVRMMQRDIIRVVDAVAPMDGSGAANIKVVRKVLQALQNKGFLDVEAVTQIEIVLKDRGIAAHDLALASSPANGDLDGHVSTSQLGQQQEQYASSTRRVNAPPKLDRKQVEQRIEEDRERHKRLRENIWAVPEGDYAELDKLWEETSDFGDDDLRMLEEEARELAQARQNSCVHKREAATKGAGAANGKRARK